MKLCDPDSIGGSSHGPAGTLSRASFMPIVHLNRPCHVSDAAVWYLESEP